ncbi:MAG: RNA polymerase sigma factor [Chloroflexaceae bacterium]|jgi:RNA polymerase sigma factor (sigma-70 family)|nr:RNA polymerase sigma factor [Chloroflexaceae bacterium]
MSDEPAYSAAELYAACQSSDLLAQAQAYDILARYLYRIVLHLVRDQPEAHEFARDCVQVALIYIHQRLADCREPNAFRAWARRVASNATIDELRRRKRLVPLIDDEADNSAVVLERPPFEATVLEELSLTELREAIRAAPISARSRRVVLGRYMDDQADEVLAQAESSLAGETVLPSHVQVTRAKDISKLRRYEPLRALLRPPDDGEG